MIIRTTSSNLLQNTQFFINLQSSSPDGIALASGRLLAMFTVRSLQFAVRTPVQTCALGSCYALGCQEINANMSSLWLVFAEVFGHSSNTDGCPDASSGPSGW
jgi:hypothetical protein